jgi:hypothetical protein
MEWLRNIPDWLKATIGLVTLVVGFVTLILNNVFLGVTISIAVILISSLLLSLYIAFSKKESELIGGRSVYRFPKRRPISIASTLLICVIIFTLIAMKPTRNLMLAAFTRVAVPQMTVGFTEDNYILIVTVSNSSDFNILLTGIEIQSTPAYTVCVSEGSPQTYVLSDTVIVYGVDENRLMILGNIYEENDAKQNVAFPVTCVIKTDNSGSCYSEVDLYIRTSLTLPARSFNDIRIAIPTSLKIKDVPDYYAPLLHIPNFTAFIVTAQTNQGKSLPSTLSLEEIYSAILNYEKDIKQIDP